MCLLQLTLGDGAAMPGLFRTVPSRQLVGGFQHLHQEGVYGSVSDELEEEEVLQTFQTDGSQGRKAEK